MARKGTEVLVNIDDIVINTEDERVNELSNKFIQERRINVFTATGFNSLLLYISKNISVDRDNIQQLEYYFIIYTQLCSICNIIPFMNGYSIFVNIPYDTISEWTRGVMKKANPSYQRLFKNMRKYCQNVCTSEAGKGNVGAIYLGKALYGLTDQPKQLTLTQNNLYVNAPVTREGIAAEFGMELSDNNNKLIENQTQ